MPDKLTKVAGGALSSFTPFAVNFVLSISYGGTTAGSFFALLFSVCLLCLWVLSRPGYLLLAITLFWCALFFFLAPFGMDTQSPVTVTFDEKYFLDAWYEQLSGLSVLSGALVLLGGFIGNLWARRKLHHN